MQINSAASSASYVPPTSANAQTQQAVRQNEDNTKRNNDLDNLLNQLSAVLTESVVTKNSSKPQALLALLSEGGSASAAAQLPPELVSLIDKITSLAESQGKGDEFKALLSEYVAVKWALTALDAEIRAEQQGEQSKIDREDRYNQLAEASAFMRQLSSALSDQLDALAAQNGYTDWLKAFKEDLDARSQLAAGEASPALPQGVNAAQLVAYLLKNAPRPDADSLHPVADAPQAAPVNPYH